MKRTIRIPLYECRVHFVVVATNREVCNYTDGICNKYGIHVERDGDDESHGEVVNILPNYWMILSEASVKSNNTILHELWHVVDKIGLDNGVKDSEALAYLQGYIGERLMKFIDGYKAKT
jgi:hypothetical protein